MEVPTKQCMLTRHGSLATIGHRRSSKGKNTHRRRIGGTFRIVASSSSHGIQGLSRHLLLPWGVIHLGGGRIRHRRRRSGVVDFGGGPIVRIRLRREEGGAGVDVDEALHVDAQPDGPGLLQDPGRSEERRRKGDQIRLPEARQAVPSGCVETSFSNPPRCESCDRQELSADASPPRFACALVI